MKHDVIHWLLIAFSVALAALAAWFFSRIAVPEEATDHVALGKVYPRKDEE